MKTILIVDDEFGIVEALASLLEDEGYRVVTAANGEDGLARLRKEQPNLVLIDLMMPIIDGQEMLRIMRSTPTHASIPVIVMSAAPKSTAVLKSEKAREISAFLRKPFDLQTLLDTIAPLIGPGEQPMSSVQSR
jgi:CheY-like chemotaxis protein